MKNLQDECFKNIKLCLPYLVLGRISFLVLINLIWSLNQMLASCNVITQRSNLTTPFEQTPINKMNIFYFYISLSLSFFLPLKYQNSWKKALLDHVQYMHFCKDEMLGEW